MKLTALQSNPSPSSDDLLYCVNDPAGTPGSYKATIAAVLGLVDLSGYAAKASANVFTAAQTITTGATGDALVVTGSNGTGKITLGSDASQRPNLLITSSSGATSINLNSVSSHVLSPLWVGASSGNPGARLRVDTGAAATVGVIVRGAASQTANLQEWQDSSGGLLGYVSGAGILSLSRGSAGNAVMSAFASGDVASRYVLANTGGQQWGPGTSATDVRLYRTGTKTLSLDDGAGGPAALNVVGSILGTGLTFTGGLTAGSSLVLSGSGTGFYSSPATDVSASCDFNFGPNLATNGGWFRFHRSTNTTGAVGVQIFRGDNSTTPNHILTGKVGNSYLCGDNGLLGIGSSGTPGAKVQIDTASASTKGLIVKGAASQTARLQEWQNSSGTALAYVDSAGKFRCAAELNISGTVLAPFAAGQLRLTNGTTAGTLYASLSGASVNLAQDPSDTVTPIYVYGDPSCLGPLAEFYGQDGIGSFVINGRGIPRLPNYTSAERPASGSPGEIIFNTTTNKLNINTGSGWVHADGSAA